MPQSEHNTGDGILTRVTRRLRKAFSAFPSGVTIGVLTALIAASAALVGNYWVKRTSTLNLLAQRENSETQLRSSMLTNLIGPFVGKLPDGGRLDTHRSRVLLELLVLNFHDHFEFKPLLEEVDQQIMAECSLEKDESACTAPSWTTPDRSALFSVARRVVDRQIAMIWAEAPGTRWSDAIGIEHRPPSEASADLFFSDCEPAGRLLLAGGNFARGIQKKDINSAANPACIGKQSGDRLCVTSAASGESYALTVSAWAAEARSRTVHVYVQYVSGNSCDQNQGWRDVSEFLLTPFDFPLTDNTQIDQRHRFALTLYSWVPGSAGDNRLIAKLVWFPEGYITERERPMNYRELRSNLGL